MPAPAPGGGDVAALRAAPGTPLSLPDPGSLLVPRQRCLRLAPQHPFRRRAGGPCCPLELPRTVPGWSRCAPRLDSCKGDVFSAKATLVYAPPSNLP